MLIEPDYPAAVYFNLGNLLRQTDPARARQCYEKAIALSPKFAEAYNNLGVLLAKTDPEAAMRCYRASLEILRRTPAHGDLAAFFNKRRSGRGNRGIRATWK